MAQKKKRKISKKRQRKIFGTFFIVSVVLVSTVWSITNHAAQKQIIKEKEAELASLEQQLSEKKKELNKKNMEANYYQSDENIEKVAKEELGLVNPQEVVFIQSN